MLNLQAYNFDHAHYAASYSYRIQTMYEWDEDDGEEEEGGSSWQEATGKNVILFLVDGTAPMQAKDPDDGTTLYQKAIEAACATMKEIPPHIELNSYAFQYKPPSIS